MSNIVVIGAGVSGLTTALLLSKKYNVTVIAKHMPGDYDPEYTSPWAGANFLPITSRDDNTEWGARTWPELARLAKDVPEAGIHFQNTRIMNREKDSEASEIRPWFKEIALNFRNIPKENLPKGIVSGTEFTSVCIDLPVYLAWLKGQCLKQGVVFKRAVIKHISDAAAYHHSCEKVSVVVNCTGILARKLGGVMDLDVVPIRGQTVLVRNEADSMYVTSGTDDGEDELCYIMQRAGGGGTILGGTYMKGDWNSQPDPNQASRIMKRAIEICPELTKGKGIESLDVIRHAVGFRPFRQSGLRLEKEKIGQDWVVHNYGHAGWGYEASYGCSADVLKQVEEILAAKSKL